MERDGLVEQRRGPVLGVGKPAMRYALTPAADTLLPKAYAPVLGVLLEALGERLGPDGLTELLREVGRRAGAGRGREGEDVRMRIEAAYGVLGELGGVAEIEESDGAVYIRGFSCPLAALVPGHPQVCQLAEALLSEIVGLPVREQCQKGPSPRCCFQIPLSGAPAGEADP
jgi:predicted ArsR family transcriptional regulator